MNKVLERFDVELDLGPTGHSQKNRIVIGGVDVTRGCRGVSVWSEPSEVTTVEVKLLPRDLLRARIQDAAVIPIFDDDRPDIQARSMIARNVVVERLRREVLGPMMALLGKENDDVRKTEQGASDG
jgi:hypothetical protein